MDPVTIAAGISAISSLAGGALSSAGASANNAANNQSAWQMAQFNAGQAQINRDWQERMSNTAYQRAMADMRAAHLNPILAYQQGGAGTPGGAQGSGSAAHFENAMEGLGHGVTSAGKSAETAIQLKQVAAATDNQSAQARVNDANVGLTNANTFKANQETATSAAELRRKNAETEILIQQSGNPEATRKQLEASANQANSAAALHRQQTKNIQYGDTPVGKNAATGELLFNRVVPAVRDLYPPALPQQKGVPPEAWSTPSESWNRHYNPDGSLRR
ncbi:MAG: DNA pilot protein [Microvirus sp.]|nr:MAG: DNA pilot protein [Microvirus sp.]